LLGLFLYGGHEHLINSVVNIEDILDYLDLEQISNVMFEPNHETQQIELTDHGKRVVEDVYDLTDDINSTTDAFTEWWETYPKHDGHGMFAPSRGLRIRREVCKSLFDDIVAKGEVSPEDLIAALHREVQGRKSNSTSRNEMKFMKSSVNYLSEEHF